MQAYFHNLEDRPYNAAMAGGRPTNKERTLLGSRIALSREAAGLSQNELAERIGISRNLIAQWERSALTLKPEQLAALAEAFAITIDELLGYAKNRKANGPTGKALKIFEQVSKLPRRQQERVLATVEDMLIAHSTKKKS
ncbi:helix-turn-helix domain-containing protein [Puniceicoccaceae bacterium K14]|nr:helix-turn-helix domain-containing protein [Puniceicoccaceae bacterium K14]